MTEAEKKMLEAAMAYTARFKGYSVDDMSEPLRKMFDAMNAVEAERGAGTKAA